VIERWNSSAGACTGGTLRVFFEYWMSRLPLPLTTADRDHGCWCLNPALVTDTFSDLRHGVRHDRERGQRPRRSGLQAEPKLCHGFDLQKLRVELSLLGRVLGITGESGITVSYLCCSGVVRVVSARHGRDGVLPLARRVPGPFPG